MKNNKTLMVIIAFLLGIGLTAGAMWLTKPQKQKTSEIHGGHDNGSHDEHDGEDHGEKDGHDDHGDEKVIQLSEQWDPGHLMSILDFPVRLK